MANRSDSIIFTATVPLDRLAAAPPDLLSQRNVEAFLGLPPRRFLEILREPGFPLEIILDGKLRLVDRADFIAWLRARGVKRPTVAPPATDADAIAGELGLRLVDGGRK